MANDEDALICNTDGCAIPAAANTDAPATAFSGELSVVSDAICPWCYVGKRRLEQAFALIGPAHRPRVTWRPYELNPQMPKAGIDRREYRMRKFGSWERSLQLDAQLTEVGKSVGITFRYDLMKRTPNTFDAHRLIWLAGQLGRQDAMVETLFRAYFSEGRDIGNVDVLAALAAEAGIERVRVQAMLAGTEGSAEVAADEEVAMRAQLSGVPTFVLDGHMLFSGAQSPELIAQALRKPIRMPA